MLVKLAFADIYMLTDKNGNVTYTDTPDRDAQKVEIASPPIHDIPPAPASVVENNKVAVLATSEQKKPYKVFEITSPLNEETIHNQPNIMIILATEPKLQTGDKIQIFVDNKPVGNPSEKTQIDIGHPDRGIHQVKAVIIDENQRILKISPAITIYVHYGIANSTS